METTSYFASYNQSAIKKLIEAKTKLNTNPNITDDLREILDAMFDVMFINTVEKY